MNKIGYGLLIAILCIGISNAQNTGPSDAHLRLVTLIKELQYVRSLISEYSSMDQEGERYLFRYDILDKRILELVEGIETHISVSNQEEKFYRLLEPSREQ